MNSAYLNQRSSQLAPLAVPVVCTLILLLLLPTEVAVVFIAVLTTSIGIVTYRLKNYLLTIFAGAFLFRIVFVIIDSVVGFLPIPPISPGHNQRAIDLATAWSNGQFFGVLGKIDPMRGLMAHVLAPFYVVLGYSPVAGRVGIAFISLFVGYLIFRLSRHVTDRQTSVLAASVVLFWPTIVYRSIVIQREIVIVVAMLAALWAAVQWLEAITLPSVIVAIVATMTVFTLRKENLVLITAVFGVLFLIKSRDRPYYLIGATLLCVPIFVYFIFNFGSFTGFGTSLTPTALDAFAYGRAHGDAAYLVGLHYRSWLDVVLYVPLKIVYFLFTPFPWQVRNVTELLVSMSAIALFAFTVLSRRGIALLKENRYYVLLLLTYAGVGITTYAIVEMNYGASVRRRIQFVPILILLAVIGLSTIRVKVQGIE